MERDKGESKITEGLASGEKREGESMEETDVVAPTGAEEGAEEDIEDEDSGRNSQSVATC